MPLLLRRSGNAALAGPGQHTTAALDRRQDLENGQEGGIIVAVVIVGLFCVALLSFIILRRLRATHDNPKYVPTDWLKRRWKLWTPPPVRKRYSKTWQNRRSVQEARRTPSPTSTLRALRSSRSHELSTPELSRERESNTNGNNNNNNSPNEPDRRTSVRSVMTLPSYTEDARATEKIIGREGERSGIDTVVEFPETGEEEEARREEEMESLYHIRVARRNERAEREERRRLRREARARGDSEMVEQLRQQARHRADSSNSLREVDSTALMQEHQSRDRGRRVSSVSYADLGVARHDGSRVRAGSNESDHQPLLESAASMGIRARSQPRPAFRNHNHNQSTSSLRFQTQTPDYSDDERASSEYEFVPTPWSSSSRRPSVSPVRPSISTAHGDIGDEPIMQSEPPQYDESIAASSVDLRRNPQQPSQPLEQAPPYQSPRSAAAPRLPAFTPLPAIEITPFSPVVGDLETHQSDRRL